MQCCHTWILGVPESSKCFLPSSGDQVYCRPWVWCPRLHLPPTTNHHLHPQGLCHLGNSRPLPHHPPAAWQPALHCLGNRVSVLQQYTVSHFKGFPFASDWLYKKTFLQIQPQHPPLPLETCRPGNSLSRRPPQALSLLCPWAPPLWCHLHLGSNPHFLPVRPLLHRPLHLAQQAWCMHHLPHPHPWTLTMWPWWGFLVCHLTGCPLRLLRLLPRVKGSD